MPSSESSTALASLTQALANRSGRLLVVTGAGISVASGIDTFRDGPDAVWSQDVMTMATRRFFNANPVEAWAWYLGRFDSVLQALPNHGHRALVSLERWCLNAGRDISLVTQNVDGLHRRAGQQHCIEVHGRLDRVRCTSSGCGRAEPKGSLPRPDDALTRFLASPEHRTLPRCEDCGGLLRPHVLWFDETYDGHADYQAAEVWRAAKQATVMLFVGTSFAVGLTDHLLQIGLTRGVFMASIDPSGRVPHRRVLSIEAKAEACLPALVTSLENY